MRAHKKLMLAGAAVVATTLTVGAFYAKRGGTDAAVITASVSRGDVVDTVVATGTLEAVTTVQVGSQLSGTIQTLYADFNSIVHKGEVLARLEPSLYPSQVDQAQANLTRAEADLDRLGVTVDDSNAQLTRARELFDRTLIQRRAHGAGRWRSQGGPKVVTNVTVSQPKAATSTVANPLFGATPGGGRFGGGGFGGGGNAGAAGRSR